MIVSFILIAFLLVLLLLNEYYYWVVCAFTQDYHMRKGEKGGPYEAIAFGSAYCRYGLDFSGTDVKGYNYGYSSQFFHYTNLMLHQYAKTCKKGGVVYLIIADLVFAKEGKGLYGAEEYVKFLDKSTLGEEYSAGRYIRSRFPVFINPRLVVSCVKRFCGIKPTDSYKSLENNSLAESEVIMEAEKRCNSWCRQFGLLNTIGNSIPEELDDVFKKTRQILTDMIQFCLDNGLKPILVVTPVSKIMNDRLGDDFIKRVLFNNISKANIQKVPMMNYLRDERFGDYHLYHNNADFLNARGRRLFTKVLVEDTYKKLKNDNRDSDLS